MFLFDGFACYHQLCPSSQQNAFSMQVNLSSEIHLLCQREDKLILNDQKDFKFWFLMLGDHERDWT
jgi:hypothetical protein